MNLKLSAPDSTPFQTPPAILVAIEEADKNYVGRLSGALNGTKTKVWAGEFSTVTELVGLAKRNGLNAVATTRTDILKKLLPPESAKTASINNYAGSIIPWGDMEFLIINPLKQLISVSYGDFLARRYISKLTKRHMWRATSKFQLTVCRSSSQLNEALSYLRNCDMIAVDCETIAPNIIRCIGYCGFKFSSNTSQAFVIPMDSMERYATCKVIHSMEIPKVLQNGKYDCAYFAGYGIPLHSYFYDTINASHAWYAELPKDIGSITSLFVRDSMYWKDLAKTNDIDEYYRYCALDCWGTGESWLTWTLESPDWAKKNYIHEFTQVPICHMMEMTGIARDQEELNRVAIEYQKKENELLDWLKAAVSPSYNPSSPPQTLKLLKILGYKKAEDSREPTILEASYVHPLNELILGKVLEYRGIRKLNSTYLTIGNDAKEFKGRILYSINPHGTDTGRKSSKEHHFWCGLQVQNIPRDGEESGAVKRTLVADPGYQFWEADFSQAEARGVAYKSGDKGLLEAVESTRDFHSINASAFFGIPYEQIFRDATEELKAKTLDKELRDLSKRTNHGANYNMGAGILLKTMGSKRVRKAQVLLKLPANWTLIDVTSFLLKVYERTYPRVKTTYYEKIKKDVRTTSKLVGDTGWVRWCFGNPSANKLDLNSYVAHVTQSLNAMLLDIAVVKVFNELAFVQEVKLNAQIHDSILFQCKIGHDHYAERVRELMTFGVPITDCLGITRNMIVPVDLKCLGKNWAGS